MTAALVAYHDDACVDTCVTHATVSTVVTGRAIGTPASEPAHAQAIADKVCATIKKMMGLPLTAQGRILLLTMSCQCRMLHYERVVQWVRISDHMLDWTLCLGGFSVGNNLLMCVH